MGDLGLSERWRKAAKQSMEHDLGWDDLAESHDAGRASDAAVRVVLEHLIDKAKTDGDAGAVEAMYALEAELNEGGDS